MRKIKRITAIAGLALVAASSLGATTASATTHSAGQGEIISIQGTCEDDYDIETSGARAGASLWCHEGKIHIDGWVKDMEADGQCAEVYGNVGNKKFDSPYACPKGDKKQFSYSGKGSTAYVYLREF